MARSRTRRFIAHRVKLRGGSRLPVPDCTLSFLDPSAFSSGTCASGYVRQYGSDASRQRCPGAGARRYERAIAARAILYSRVTHRIHVKLLQLSPAPAVCPLPLAASTPHSLLATVSMSPSHTLARTSRLVLSRACGPRDPPCAVSGVTLPSSLSAYEAVSPSSPSPRGEHRPRRRRRAGSPAFPHASSSRTDRTRRWQGRSRARRGASS